MKIRDIIKGRDGDRKPLMTIFESGNECKVEFCEDVDKSISAFSAIICSLSKNGNHDLLKWMFSVLVMVLAELGEETARKFIDGLEEIIPKAKGIMNKYKQ